MDWLLVIAVFGAVERDTRIERMTEQQCMAILSYGLRDDRVSVRCLSPDGRWFKRGSN